MGYERVIRLSTISCRGYPRQRPYKPPAVAGCQGGGCSWGLGIDDMSGAHGGVGFGGPLVGCCIDGGVVGPGELSGGCWGAGVVVGFVGGFMRRGAGVLGDCWVGWCSECGLGIGFHICE